MKQSFKTASFYFFTLSISSAEQSKKLHSFDSVARVG